MGWIEIVWGSYALIAALALMMAWREQVGQGRHGFLPHLVGCLACMLWPLAFAAVLIEAKRQGA